MIIYSSLFLKHVYTHFTNVPKSTLMLVKLPLQSVYACCTLKLGKGIPEFHLHVC